MTVDDWVSHANVEISECENGLEFKRKTGDSTFNYFTALFQNPLLDKCVYKVNVESVYDSDRFVDVGIITKTKFEQTKGTFVNSYSSGGISYCGYSHCGGLTGTSPTTSASSTDGLKPGSHFYLSYDPGKEIKFYNDEGTVNLTKSLEGDTNEYYLFCVVYHPPTRYILEKIE